MVTDMTEGGNWHDTKLNMYIKLLFGVYKFNNTPELLIQLKSMYCHSVKNAILHTLNGKYQSS